MEARGRRRARALAAVVVAAVLCDSAAWRARAAAEMIVPIGVAPKCPAPATVRHGERTKLGFSPDDALRTLRRIGETSSV